MPNIDLDNVFIHFGIDVFVKWTLVKYCNSAELFRLMLKIRIIGFRPVFEGRATN